MNSAEKPFTCANPSKMRSEDGTQIKNSKGFVDTIKMLAEFLKSPEERKSSQDSFP